jgi:hypothetical protein
MLTETLMKIFAQNFNERQAIDLAKGLMQALPLAS